MRVDIAARNNQWKHVANAAAVTDETLAFSRFVCLKVALSIRASLCARPISMIASHCMIACRR